MRGIESYRGQEIGILGLGRTGLALLRALRGAGVAVRAFDDREEALERAVAEGARRGNPADVAGLSLLIASPGVPLRFPQPHPVIRQAREAGVEIAGDIDLFAASFPSLPLIGVTGTNGKSTTSALVSHLLRECGMPAVAAGNIGRPVFGLDPTVPQTVVLELSSFQLDLSEGLPLRAAVWLNLAPDHLDRHGDMAGYVAAKRRIFRGMAADRPHIIGIDDPLSAALADELECAGRRVVRISGRWPDADFGVRGTKLVERRGSGAFERADLDRLSRLKGPHNRQNVAAAMAVVRSMGLAMESAATALPAFPGLPHRMEEVGRIAGVRFVNDSKATNPEAAARGLESCENIYWIAGGRSKPGGFDALAGSLGRVRRAYLIGEAASEIGRFLEGRLPKVMCGELAEAVRRAFGDALREGGGTATVLLAPACASFDQFVDYEARGEAFSALVRSLAEGCVGESS